MRTLTHFLLWNVGLAKAGTQTTKAERDCLRRHAANKRRLVEIGVWHGVTTTCLREVMAPDGVLIAVDPYPRGRLGVSLQQIISKREVGRLTRGTVRWVRTTGAEAAQRHAVHKAEPIDFIFIDGDHSYDAIAADWYGWSPLVGPRGVVALHDSRSGAGRNLDDAGSAVFTREVILQDPRFAVIDEVDTLTVLQRTAE